MLDYNKIISSKAKTIQPSGIRRFFDIANEMKNVISLSVGEPDFKTPFDVRMEGIRTLQKGHTWYSANTGMLELRQEISRYLDRRFDLSYCPETEVLVTVGGSEAIDLSFRALLNPGDEVLIPEPSFVCYAPLVTMAGGTPILIETKAEDQFRLTKQALAEKITPKTKLLVLPYPNNPTGGVMRKQHLEQLAEVLRETNIVVVSDEIYAELTYNGHHVSIASLPNMRERTVVVSGFSKAYAMTGWRMGYAVAPAPLLKYLSRIHQYAIMCAPTTSQYAAIQALRDGDESVAHMASEYNMRRRLVVDLFNAMGLTTFEPEGAFYIFPCIQSTGMSSEEFCEKLLMSQQVAVIPGNAFGPSGEGFVRVSYSYSVKHLLEAAKRIERFLQDLDGSDHQDV